MLSLFDIQELVSTGFFDGDMQLAGICMYILVLVAIFALTRKTTQTLIIGLPVTLVFSILGVLSTDLMILLIIVSVLGLAATAQKIWRD